MTRDSTASAKTGGNTLDRSHHYRAGVLLESGLMLSGNRVSNIADPGPGHYDPICTTDINYSTSKEHARGANFGRNSPNSKHNNFINSPEKAQDNSIHTSILKDGLMIKLVGHGDSHIGPGTYDVPLSTFKVKSFNNRVNKSLQHQQKIRSPRRGVLRTPDKGEGLNRRHSFQGVPLKYNSP